MASRWLHSGKAADRWLPPCMPSSALCFIMLKLARLLSGLLPIAPWTSLAHMYISHVHTSESAINLSRE